ncbi:PepSY-associated TM helix domain-containing protein [Novosphingobium beihaiensis]|uniref:PepSY domain-containing protein n=1 Tax=Novosphingobium beihaiensis TaxID=2930389 RepID=A0ABT0BV12_9SPHN|nr:PepSY-associated TM helix domain-containing protein [Novosphingobium beihaiensis]MCJ2188820.1 PepSY domain-containing protein [Novosphingobium beihaiensis]
MKETLRQTMAWLHTWVGLVAGWVLFFVFVTGTTGYFQQEITRWMEPERPLEVAPAPYDSSELVGLAMQRLEQVAPVAASWSITLPHQEASGRGWNDFSIRWEEMPQPGHDFGARTTERLDPETGAVLPPEAEPRDTAGGFGLYRMHYSLHYLPYDWAIRIVGIATMLMLLAIVSGIVTHKKIIRDFFTFRPGKGQRSWLDAHNAVSVMALPFFLMITYTGLVFFLFQYMPAGRDMLYGTGDDSVDAYYEELYGEHEHAAIGRPAAPIAPLLKQAEAAWGKGHLASIAVERHKGEEPEIVLSRARIGLDYYIPPQLRFHATTGARLPAEPRAGGGTLATAQVMYSLHEGHFTGIWGRWLYFAAGLLGCGMIGTGLTLWAVKRRLRHLSEGREADEHFGIRLVEVLNVATIAGLPLAVAGFFWANRLLPVAMLDRAAWEFHSLFAVWLGTLFYALGRPLRRAWIELLWATSAAFALIPVVNALTTDRHLGVTLAHGDWVLAGFDLTMLGLGAAFALTAVKVARRLKPQVPAAEGAATSSLEPALKESRA